MDFQMPMRQAFSLPSNADALGSWDEETSYGQPFSENPTKRFKRSVEESATGAQQEPWAIDDPYSGVWEVPGYPPEAFEHTGIASDQMMFPTPQDLLAVHGRRKMQTGCIPCLMKGIPCDPRNPGCKRAMSDDWNLNYKNETNGIDDDTETSMSLSIFRPDTKWRRSWRERHSLNFFVNFSAPQMAGFFDSTFWQRLVIQISYHEPAILHAITAIGALHECIMQRNFVDETRKARAEEFALSQCNKAIACLTRSGVTGNDFSKRSSKTPNTSIALTTCVLFTCFEAMQGRCDSAVNHAIQGRRLLQAATDTPQGSPTSPQEEDDLEQMRPIVERLEVQATALVEKGMREVSDGAVPLPALDYIFSLDHAHNTLHTALNSVMRFMQGYQPTAPREAIVARMEAKQALYGPWFRQWEDAFTMYLSTHREHMSSRDFKRAMVLKANHLSGTMLAAVDQSAGPIAYDPYEAEFRAVVDLSREVLASFSCPPLPTLTGGSSGTPYLSFSLWVTDPLWMAVSRCHNHSIRQAAFTLLAQNPRQEGIWHAGPTSTTGRNVKKSETSPKGSDTSKLKSPGDAKTSKRKNGRANNNKNSNLRGRQRVVGTMVESSRKGGVQADGAQAPSKAGSIGQRSTRWYAKSGQQSSTTGA